MRGEVERPRQPHPGRHVQQRASARAAAALDARHGARERRRVERPTVPDGTEARHGHPRPAPRRGRRGPRARLLRPGRRRQQQQQHRRREQAQRRRRHPSFLARAAQQQWVTAVQCSEVLTTEAE